MKNTKERKVDGMIVVEPPSDFPLGTDTIKHEWYVNTADFKNDSTSTPETALLLVKIDSLEQQLDALQKEKDHYQREASLLKARCEQLEVTIAVLSPKGIYR